MGRLRSYLVENAPWGLKGTLPEVWRNKRRVEAHRKNPVAVLNQGMRWREHVN
jgi:hypothetical protein